MGLYTRSFQSAGQIIFLTATWVSPSLCWLLDRCRENSPTPLGCAERIPCFLHLPFRWFPCLLSVPEISPTPPIRNLDSSNTCICHSLKNKHQEDDAERRIPEPICPHPGLWGDLLRWGGNPNKGDSLHPNIFLPFIFSPPRHPPL